MKAQSENELQRLVAEGHDSQLTKQVIVASLRPMRIGFLALSLAGMFGITTAAAQECQDTPEGRICSVQQPITVGAEVSIEQQRQMGLVTINNGCSGTLLNRFWVLTARHCITQPPPVAGSARTVNDPISNPHLPPNQVTVTAAWAPGAVGIAERIYEFQLNVNEFAANVNATTTIRDIVLIFLGTADVGPVDSQRIYAAVRDSKLTGRLTTTDTVTQYGRGFSTFASGTFGTPTATPAGGAGPYRSARFTPSGIIPTHYNLAMNTNNQVGHGGDSGGPTVVTVDNRSVGIAGVQSTCNGTFLAGAPTNIWMWATGITFCTYVSTEPFWAELRNVTKETPGVGANLFQRHIDGRIWKYDGNGQCTIAACPGWREIDHNPRTQEIATALGTLFQRHVDGKIYKYDGIGRCTAAACPGWTEIDHNTRTAVIAGGSDGFYQRHVDGRIWKYDGQGQCTVSACPGWTEIDHNPRTADLVTALGTLYQRHVDGKIYKYDGIGRCTTAACPGWTEIDHNTRTAAIAGGSNGFYQRHVDGRIWKYDGLGQCTVSACPGWTEIDHNPRTKDIVAGDLLYQLHVDGRIFKYNGNGQCTVNACPGWTEIDHNPRTAAIVPRVLGLYQLHVDGRIWKYDGQGQCTVSACPGWTEIDHNPRTAGIAAIK